MVNKMISNIIKERKYNELLCSTFNIPLDSTKIIPYNFKTDLFDMIDYDDNKKIIINDFSVNYGIYLKTDFIFYLDNLFIGIYDSKYIVSFDESDLSFSFVGDNESNWIENSYGWAKKYSLDFKKLCYEHFGIPINQFHPEKAFSMDDIIKMSYIEF